MKQLQYTIRNVSPELDAKLRAKAQREKKSFNALLLDQLDLSLRKISASSTQISNDYDDLVGSWVDDPGFDEAMGDMRVVDPKDWQ